MSMQISSVKLGKLNFVLFILFTFFSQHKFRNAVSYPNIFTSIMQLTSIITVCPYCKREPFRMYYCATGFICWSEYI